MLNALPSPAEPLRIGTRGSPLALAQAYETRDRLAQAYDLPHEAFVIEVIKMTGDMVQDKALREIGGKGLFTREIEEALLDGSIDIAVHSMKDMPVEQPAGLTLDCFLPREDVRDAFVSRHNWSLNDIPAGKVLGTSSLRRRAQILARRPDLVVVEFRGNVQTRLRKLDEGVADATFLAMAGLNRLGRADVPQKPLSPAEMLPAVAQGAIGVERRTDDRIVAGLLAAIHHGPTGTRLAAERAFLAGLDGSCHTPIAGLAEIQGDELTLRGEILRPDGSEVLADQMRCAVTDAAVIGAEMARKMRALAGEGFFTLG
ncbi:porphobilinogen deaminase [Ketogulonicigenium robustum]|uniref:Porphobilinogen deaminase n=1 Tax=Ketogulonicigenium robustum TaxID=92947 RepID=A0A1W6NY15_9RHOB|nr:hydroxymethylbilane synthase [Ketogulonicigenium robustum]ARO14053.1 porphobilinogen deaminase [Ketogulonicigenium robustum]